MDILNMIKLAYEEQWATKDDVFQKVVDQKITSEQYFEIVSEECPEIHIDVLKQKKISELWMACNHAILSGFYSSVSGEELFFGFDTMDQSNLTGVMAMIDLALEPIRWKVKGELQFVDLTKEQFKQLCLDGKSHKEENMHKYFELIGQVGLSTSEDELSSIQW